MYFGGIQVIGGGSFKQLPPVPNFNDPALFCFQIPIFTGVFPHHMFLNEVIWQNEEDLIGAINELCDSEPSAETVTLMKQLSRPLSVVHQLKATYILAPILM